MSRIGKKAIKLPEGVTVEQQNQALLVKGPKGELAINLPKNINYQVDEGHLLVTRADDNKINRQNHGTTAALLNNAIMGVSQGFEKNLELVGIGYRAILQPSGAVQLNVGYSHPVIIVPQQGVTITVPDATKINVSGIDKQAVGETAANIRKVRPPEPYQGKGIKYKGERIIRKEGKRAAKK